jgi:D-sedoheptulose 7-phosphate isomerase
MNSPNNVHAAKFLADAIKIIEKLDKNEIDELTLEILQLKKSQGRIFFAGSGGGAGHASHAACDFRKILGIESYSISDNVSELTARVNDESWRDAYSNWLKVSRISKSDALFVISVGGGSVDHNISENLISAINLAVSNGAKVLGLVGRDGGYLKEKADACVLIPVVDESFITAQTEGFQSILWHLLIADPRLEGSTPTWEKRFEE